MKQIKFLYFFAFTLMFVGLTAPLLSFAHTPSIWPTGFWGPLVSCGSGPGLEPCTSLCDILHTAIHLIYFGISIAIFLFAPISLAIGGIMILIAGGDTGRLTRGKEILKLTIYGIVIVLASFLVIKLFITAIGVKSGYIQGFNDSFNCQIKP